MTKVRCNWCDEVFYEDKIVVIDENEFCYKCNKTGFLMDYEYIPLDKAITLIDDATGIILDDDIMTYAYPDTTRPRFLEISIHREETICFNRIDNDPVNIKDNVMYLVDSLGREHEISLLQTKNIEK
jgi:hypothetical protein